MATAQIEKVVNVYKLLSQSRTLNELKILHVGKNAIIVEAIWGQRNLERSLKQQFIQHYTLDANLKIVSQTFPSDITDELLTAVTENEEYRATLKQVVTDNSTKQFVEIWNKDRILKNYDVGALDVHGDIYYDSEFGTFEWSPDNTKVLYIAEKKLPKSEAFYKQKSIDKKEKEKKEDDALPGNEYVYKSHWGEQLVGKHRPVVMVLDRTTDKIVPLPGIPDDLSPGQVLWTKDGKSVVGVAWKHEPRHLGLMVCTNRDSWIFLLQDGQYHKLSRDGCAVRTPRFSPNGKYLVWLEREADGPHHNAHRLMCLDFESQDRKIEVLIDVVGESKIINNKKVFYGLYSRLPRRCWSNDSQYIFLSTPQESSVHSYIFDMKTRSITEIQKDESSVVILDIKNDVIAFLRTSLLEPPCLSVGYFNSKMASNGNIPRSEITAPLKISGFEEIMYEHTRYKYNNDEEVNEFNFTYFGPKNGKNESVPFIVTPHGGPHSNFMNAFSLDYSLLALLGLGVLQVNYRGSTGMGSKNVEYLQGKVGVTDVKDCVTATHEALKKYPWLSPSSIGLYGGSHGGFLVTHLSAQYPDLYKVVVAKNPVVNIATMYFISDIPDCRNTLTMEEKIAYHHNACMSAVHGTSFPQAERYKLNIPEMFTKMLSCSPIVHVNNVKAPTLVCIGKNDLRVPHSQGKDWYQALKTNNVKTKMLVYEDNHRLASGKVEIDSVINAYLWLIEHISSDEHPESIEK